jgi:hypothetical protein
MRWWTRCGRGGCVSAIAGRQVASSELERAKVAVTVAADAGGDRIACGSTTPPPVAQERGGARMSSLSKVDRAAAEVLALNSLAAQSARALEMSRHGSAVQ